MFLYNKEVHFQPATGHDGMMPRVEFHEPGGVERELSWQIAASTSEDGEYVNDPETCGESLAA